MYKKQSLALLDFNILSGEFEGFDYSNPKICHGGKGSGGGTNTVTNNSQPPAQVLQAYQTALNGAQSAASQPLQQYTGPTVAGFTPDQLSAFGTINNAQGAAQPFINQAQGLIQQGTQPLWSGVQQFSPNAVSQYASPYTQNVLQTTMASEQNQDAQQQAALQGNAISSGAWGGDRAGVASAILSGQQALANNQTNANIENTGYNTALGEFNTQQQAQLGANEANSYLNQQGAFGLANLGQEALGTQLTGASAQLQSGGLQQQLGQEALNVPYQNFLQQQAYPFQTAQYFANIAEGIGSGSGGTSSTTSPGASTASQVGGLGLAGLGLANSGLFSGLGASSAGGISSLVSGLGAATSSSGVDAALAGLTFGFNKGGSVKGYDAGGSIQLPGVPDVSVSYIPQTQQTHGGLGVPRAPAAYQEQNPLSEGQQFSQLAMGIGNMDGTTGHARGGRTHFDDGGQVGGQTPITASGATMNPYQQGQNSSYQNMTPQQLQQYIMRLPANSPQAQAATAVLQQKRMMPNVGVQAQGGLGSQQPTMASGGRLHYDDGGSLPPPTDPDQAAREADLQSELGQEQAQNLSSAIPLSALQPSGGSSAPAAQPPSGGMGTQRMTASATPPSGAEDTPPTPQHRNVNPWLALAQAGFAIAGGTSPYAGVNIGRGAMQGIDNLTQQQRETDTVNEAADKLMQEAKQHRDQIAIEQQNADTNKQHVGNEADYQKSVLAQGKFIPVTDAMGNKSIYNTATKEWITQPNSQSVNTAVLSGPDGSPLTGDAYLQELQKKNPTMAAQVKAMDEGDLNFPSGFAAKAPYWQQRLDALYNYNPNASQQTAGAYKQFMSGPLGNTVRSINVATNHINLADQLIDAMNNGDTKRLNQLGNVAKTEFGLSGAPTDLNAVKTLLSGELEKAAAGNIGAVTDRTALAEQLNNANSPELLHGVTKQFKALMGGQYGGLQQQYEAQTGRKDFRKFLTPASEEAIGLASGVQGQASSNALTPSPTDISYLKTHPEIAHKFDTRFGTGASKQYLEQP